MNSNHINELKINCSFCTFLNIINEWTVPKLPVSGNDIIDTKKINKINIGKTIRALEEWWVKKNFKPNKKKVRL